MDTSLAMWWPQSEDLEDLIVKDSEGGFELEAPSGSKCAEWLNYWNQSDEHRSFFNEQFVSMLTDYLTTLDGKTQIQSNQ